MKVREETVSIDLALVQAGLREHDISSELRRQSARDESCVHLSDILKYIAVRGKLLKPETITLGKQRYTFIEELDEREQYGHVTNDSGGIINAVLPGFPLRMALGMAWENWIRGMYPEMMWQPPPLRRDGIGMSPDGLTYVDRIVPEAWLDEFKLTWKSSEQGGQPRDIRKEWLWLAQVKGYCDSAGTGAGDEKWKLSNACLHVCYVNGNYRFGQPGGGPVYKRYWLEFEEAELEQNWKLVVRNRDAAEREMKARQRVRSHER